MVIAGSIDVDGADKAAHFITVADSFHLPLVFFADNPGVLPGTASEKARHPAQRRAHVRRAQTIATSPKFEVTFRKAYGFGSMVMGMIPFDGQSAVFAFPGATMGAMGAAAMGRATNADEDEAERLRRAELQASYGTANSFGFDELIDPRETRNMLLHSLERARRRQEAAEPVAAVGITLMTDIPWIVSVDDHVIEPPNSGPRACPRVRGTRDRTWSGCRPASSSSAGTRYVEAPGTDGPRVDYWVYERPVPVVEAGGRGGRSRPRRHDDDRHDLRRDAARLLRPEAARSRTWTRTGSRRRCRFPNFPRFCGQTFLEAKDRDLALLCVAGVQRLDGRGVVRRRAAAGSSRCASSRCGTPTLAAAEVERNAARGVRAVCFSEIPAYLGLPSIHSGEWDPFFAACEETGTVRVHAHRFGHEDAVDVGRRAARRHGRPSASATA